VEAEKQMDDFPQSVHDAETGTAKTSMSHCEQVEREQAPGQLPASDEIGGPKGPEPTRYGDWERKGRCIDF
jgi:hypothetical protein